MRVFVSRLLVAIAVAVVVFLVTQLWQFLAESWGDHITLRLR